MRILVLSNLFPPDFIGGYELCCSQMVDALRGAGHEVLVLTCSPRIPCPADPGIERTLKLSNIYDGWSMGQSTPAICNEWESQANFVSAHNVQILLDAVRDFRPEVAYLWNLIGLGGLGLVAALQQAEIPWVWYLGDAVPRLLCSRRERVVPALANQFNRLARGHYMPVSSRLVDEIESGGVSLGDSVDVTPNWIQGTRPPPRTKFFAPGEHLRIVSAGQLGRHKGIDILIEAAHALTLQGRTNFTIDLYGALGDPTLRESVTRYNLHDRVRFLGVRPQKELIRLYADHQYDVYAFPTWRREPFGCGPVEAAAYGCLPVMSQNCGVSEFFVDNVHCLKAPRKAEAYTEIFANILDGKVDVAGISQRACDVIWRDFHIDRILSKVEEALYRASSNAAMDLNDDSAGRIYRLALLGEKLTHVLMQET